MIRANLHRSSYTTVVRSPDVRPRYCPSVEDKIVRFAGRAQHNIFLEPGGVETMRTVYPNGISTSLPEEVQQAMLATIPGLERAVMTRRAMPWNTIMWIRVP